MRDILKGKWLYNPAWSIDDDNTEEPIWNDPYVSLKAKGVSPLTTRFWSA